MRPSVCGYDKDSAFTLRDFGAPIFTGGGWRGLCLSSPWFWCSMVSAKCDPFDVQLQHHRFGPRLSFRSSERPVNSTRNWRNCTFLDQISNGAQISRQVVCRVSGQKSELRAHQMVVPGQRRTSQELCVFGSVILAGCCGIAAKDPERALSSPPQCSGARVLASEATRRRDTWWCTS